ncbi:hypothetical protein [Brevibacillus laterosporus]|uniref:Uncharacterized protein n=1 Tax=Brevibacillus laterosporus TaxID=1465 RepID=A0AAP3DFI4_BRELA|nr:hypothetical protein [Brevibacillus laterosporus]MCR8979766.1 hypothetical protein [Brevibacillus laterosporus]MCZ0806921.1 hypothetical protein [Brevibacillus laterosporus]MCZ0825196.1 hypothetical protein [Brevibacillus laterosporus]MCZ0849987.1 hypothetical protein [Brevibacillus laterosporus]MED1666977.1 hypothetical protein [Brevibacillus laterosporus]
MQTMLDTFKIQMIIAEKVHFSEYEKAHSIEKVLNAITVPILPAAVKTDVLVKVFLKEDTPALQSSIQVLDQEDRLLCNEELPPLKNFRKEGMVPGIDMFVNIRFPVVEEGVYTYRLYIDNELMAESYVSVFCEE